MHSIFLLQQGYEHLPKSRLHVPCGIAPDQYLIPSKPRSFLLNPLIKGHGLIKVAVPIFVASHD